MSDKEEVSIKVRYIYPERLAISPTRHELERYMPIRMDRVSGSDMLWRGVYYGGSRHKGITVTYRDQDSSVQIWDCEPSRFAAYVRGERLMPTRSGSGKMDKDDACVADLVLRLIETHTG